LDAAAIDPRKTGLAQPNPELWRAGEPGSRSKKLTRPQLA